jgi:hypothetical protein
MRLPQGTMGILCCLFLGLSFAFMIVHLVLCYFEVEKWRKITKPFCLLFLALAVAMAIPDHPLVYVAAFLGFLGDIILIWKDKKTCVGAGVLCFWGGHGCYIATILTTLYHAGVFDSSPYAWAWMILFLVVWMGLMVYPMYRITAHSKLFTIFGVFYSTILVSVGASAILGCSLGYSDYLYLVIIGDIFFILSDSTLAYTIFIHDIKRRDFYIMLTYLLGQSFILTGLVLTFLK